MKFIFKITISSFIFVLTLSVFFAFLSYAIYNQLTDEKSIATIYFEKQEDKIYKAILKREEGSDFSSYIIYGDQWRIDAKFIKIKPWANVLGFDAQYKLSRLEGRYSNIIEQNNNKKISYDLAKNDAINMPKFLIDWNYLIDAEYGSSSYKKIKQHTKYTVMRTQFGLIIRENPIKNNKNKGFIESLFN